MLSDENRIRLSHMRDAASEALSFIAGKTRFDLSHDRQLTLALVKSIEIIGEAAVKVTDEWKQASSEIPWRDIVAMRNRLIHAYFDIDLDILWETVTKELPSLLQVIEESLRSEKE